MTIEDIPTDSSTSLYEKEILQRLIRDTNAQIIVEVGTHRGLTTLYLAEAALDTGGHVYTYDPVHWNQRRTFGNFPELPITFQSAKGTDCRLTNIDFLFLDGYHETDLVAEEIAHFWERLAEHAVVVFHDTKERNEKCDVVSAIERAGLLAQYLDTENGMAVVSV